MPQLSRFYCTCTETLRVILVDCRNTAEPPRRGLDPQWRHASERRASGTRSDQTWEEAKDLHLLGVVLVIRPYWARLSFLSFGNSSLDPNSEKNNCLLGCLLDVLGHCFTSLGVCKHAPYPSPKVQSTNLMTPGFYVRNCYCGLGQVLLVICKPGASGQGPTVHRYEVCIGFLYQER